MGTTSLLHPGGVVLAVWNEPIIKIRPFAKFRARSVSKISILLRSPGSWFRPIPSYCSSFFLFFFLKEDIKRKQNHYSQCPILLLVNNTPWSRTHFWNSNANAIGTYYFGLPSSFQHTF